MSYLSPALVVECPTCGAKPYQPCTWRSGAHAPIRYDQPHGDRITALRSLIAEASQA